jgi:hypothetical protein
MKATSAPQIDERTQ